MFEAAAKMAAKGSGATEMDRLRVEVHHYRMLCGKFRNQAQEALDIPDS
ncbi:hypothetical protein ABZS53_37315 [Streptomyces sp. NPDC005499]